MKTNAFILIMLFTINCFSQGSLTSELSSNKIDDEVQQFHYYPHKEKEKWGYVNEYGWKKIDCQFEEAFIFLEDLALVKKNGKYGFINSKGDFIIKCEYDNAKSFHNGYAWVKKNGEEALITKDNHPFLDYWFISIEQFSDNFAKVIFKNDSISKILNNKFIVAYVASNGKQLSNNWYSGGSSFKNGKAKVSISNEYFYLDTLGRLIYRIHEECDESEPYNPNFQYDKRAIFPHGEFGLIKFINENLKYPVQAKKQGIQGAVYVEFTINKKGRPINATIYRGVHPIVDEEALRVINLLPNWTPALNNNHPVCSKYILPVTFELF